MFVVLPSIQRNVGDCGVCALEMVTAKPYQTIYQEASREAKNHGRDGLHRTQLVRIAERLGLRTRYLRNGRFDPEEDDGILCLVPTKNHRASGGHYAVLFNGTVFNPADMQAWKYEAYLQDRPDFFPIGLLVVTQRGDA